MESFNPPPDSTYNSVGFKGQKFPLIRTKVQIPNRRPDLLARPRLVNFFHGNLDRKLIILSAPAGYGKTSLLVDFANDTDLPVCWYTLDSFDRDPRVFLEYLVMALTERFPDFGANTRLVLDQIQDPGSNLYPIVAALVGEIQEKIPEYFVLILDDFHTVEDHESINEFIELFLSYVDENCHLILSSRTLPSLSNLPLLIARRQAVGTGVEDLRFTAHEIQSLAQQTHNTFISQQQAEWLVQHSGGWVTGLLLSQFSQSGDISRQPTWGSQINQEVFKFLSSQILDHQPQDLRNFMLEVSILDEINPLLCEKILGFSQPVAMIDQVRARNLFVIEYKGEIDRLYFSEFFRDFLRTTFQRENEPRFRELILKLANYYVNTGEWERSIFFYLLLREYTIVVDLIESRAHYLYTIGRWDTLINWFESIPNQVLETKPILLLTRGKINGERGDYEKALALFEQAERIYTHAGNLPDLAHALVLKGTIHRFQGLYTLAITQCQQAFALLQGVTQNEKKTLALAYKNLGLCLLMLSQPEDARHALIQSLNLFEEFSGRQDIGMVQHDLGWSAELAGDLDKAIRHYQAALTCWRELGNPSPWANTLNNLGVAFFYQGNYVQADQVLEEALSKAKLAMDQRIQAYVYASLGDLHRDLGRYEQAANDYGQALAISQGIHVGFITCYALDGLGNLERLRGNLPGARSTLQQAIELAEAHESAYELGICNISLGMVANEEANLSAAETYLDQAIIMLESAGLQQQLARANLHRSHTMFLAGFADQADVSLNKTLRLKGQFNGDQFLVADGRAVFPLLVYSIRLHPNLPYLHTFYEKVLDYEKQLDFKPLPLAIKEVQPVLKIFALGSPRVDAADQSVQWVVARSRDLFFLMLQQPKGLTKEQIGAIFWPEHGPERLDSAFRSTLYRLRRVVNRDAVSFQDGQYHFNWSIEYWYDVEAFEGYLNQVQQASSREAIDLLENALSLYQGDYLQGIYSDWITVERERLRVKYVSALNQLATLYFEQGKLVRSVELYQQMLKNEPFHESAHRELMRCYYQLGDRAAAIRQYHACMNMLRDELGLSPSMETEKLYLLIID